MNIVNNEIDGGRPFDWGKTSSDYARYRDIYPVQFYENIVKRGVGIKGQKALDLGTGTGVIPRNMYRFGAKWTGCDISENQILQAKKLSEGMDIEYYARPTEALGFPAGSFDVITACQCFFYFDHEKTAGILHDILRDGGKLLVLYMAWLPDEDMIAGESEKLVLKYNPGWTGCGEHIHPIFIPECYDGKFRLTFRDEYRLGVPFTRESWNGRIKACRGIGASLSEDKIAEWEKEHTELLEKIAPEQFEIMHYAAMAELEKI